MGYLPLAGVRVLDLTRLIPGALATRKLADLGADVVKIEEPATGDYLRAIPPFVGGRSLMYDLLNRSKRSVALDLHDAGDRGTFAQLVARADAVVEVSRPGRFAAAGVDLAELARRRPDLVVCSLTGFGQDGPLAGLPAHGMNIDALAGCLGVDEGEPPSFGPGVFTSLGAELGGLNAALAVTAALFGARATGRGATIDASCWDACVEANRIGLVHYLVTGRELRVQDATGPLYSLYRTADGRVVLFAAVERRFWENFVAGVGRPDLASRWSEAAGGAVDFGLDASLGKELADLFAAHSAEMWMDRFLEWDVPGSVVRTVPDLAADAHLAARGLVDGTADGHVTVADPFRWGDGTRPGAGGRSAPELGADTETVLAEWLG